LRTAWKEGEVRPTEKPAEKPKRGRRRPDPLADVTDRLRGVPIKKIARDLRVTFQKEP